MGKVGSKQDLDDRYHIQKVKLGEGSFSCVWRAVDRGTKELVAIKQMDKALLTKRSVKRADVEREIAMLSSCEHVNITRLIATFEDERFISLALEYCDGGDFGDKVKESVSTLTEPQAADWMWQICSAIHALHSNRICHRDIKPENFMVAGETLKLADFGLAVKVSLGQLLKEHCGTPAFMAPELYEVANGGTGYSFPIDVWAAGLVLCMLVSGGAHPFVSGSQLDQKRLMQGAVNYSACRGFSGRAVFSQGAPEAAIQLCRRMVVARPEARVTVASALQDPWLEGSRRRLGSSSRSAFPGIAQSLMGLLPLCSYPVPGRAPWPCESEDAGYNRHTDTVKAQAFASSTPSHRSREAESPSVGPQTSPKERMSPGSGTAASPAPPPAAQLPRRDMDPTSTRTTSFFESFMGVFTQPPTMKGTRSEPLSYAGTGGGGGSVAGGTSSDTFILSDGPPRDNSPRAPQRMMTKLPSAGGRIMESIMESFYVGGKASATGSRGRLPKGTKCRYASASYSGHPLRAVVEGFNDEDGTYNLNVRPHASLMNISPDKDVSAADAWPPGTLVTYTSPTMNSSLPAIIESFNEGGGGVEGTYNLDVRMHATVDRIRPRLA